MLLVLILLSSIYAGTIEFTIASSDEWISKAPLSHPRRELGVTSVNGKIYAIGGLGSSGVLKVNEEYDPIADIWTEKTAMLTPRANFGICVYQNKIYCIGGTTSGGANERYMTHQFSEINVTGLNEVYDPKTNTWETKMAMPTPRADVSVSVVNGKIYVIGGFETDLKSYGKVEVYDPSNDSWTSETLMLNPVSNCASATVDDTIYLFGGEEDAFGSGEQLEYTQAYNTQTKIWSYKQSNPSKLLTPVAVVTSGLFAPKRIYVIDYHKNHVYDTETDSWSSATPAKWGNERFGLAIVDDLIYQVGGGSGSFPTLYFYDRTEQYIPLGYVGSGLPDLPNNSPSPTPISGSDPTPTIEPEPFPATLIITSIAIITVVGLGILTYYKKYRKKT